MGHSLLTRLLIASVLVAVCSIAATAWLAVQSTSGAIRQQQGQALAADQTIYDRLLEHAGTRPIWDGGTDQLIAELERETGRRITLTAPENRRHLAGDELNPLPVKASAIVDPFNVDLTLRQGERIDARLTGPFQLPDTEIAQLQNLADQQRACFEKSGVQTVTVSAPSGRLMVETPGRPASTLQSRCLLTHVGIGDSVLSVRTPTEEKAIAQLQALMDTCMRRQNLEVEPILLNASGTPIVLPDAERREAATTCLYDSRHQQLDMYVAPPALLFITNREGAPEIGLTKAGTTRIVGAALAVLLLTIVVSVLVATRLVRPLKALTVAAQRMRAGDTEARVETKTRGEIGEVADAFNEMAEHLARTEQQRKTMISDVSHELRTPLGNIRGWLTATQDDLAELDADLVASLLEEALLLQHLVDDLQQLALADAGQLALHKEHINAADVLDQFAGHDRVVVDREPRLELEADSIRLRQAVGNLVTNALRHSENDVVLKGWKENGHIRIDVTDTGHGIGEEDLPHVFERFWRADKSRNRQTGGSGLGLAIVRNLVELHGGTVEVASTENLGTTFTLKLPA